MTLLPPLVCVLSDGIRGHLFQSRGVAAQLARLASIRIEELEVPLFEGAQRLKKIKLASRFLPAASAEDAAAWLQSAGATVLLEQVRQAIDGSSQPPLFLSAGSGVAPFCLALAKVTGGKSCVCMTPSVLGTDPFDMAVVPRHDGRQGPNVLVTLGAPNHIDASQLLDQAKELLMSYPLHRSKAWGVLVGGDDKNYRVSPRWVDRFLTPLFQAAAEADVDLYITTSRRTAPETETAIQDRCENQPRVRMVMLASRDQRNPVPAMLGFCEKIFCTEDSVSMISETATAGVPQAVVPVEHHKRLGALLQLAADGLSRAGLLSPEKLWGVPKFRRMIDVFEAQGLARTVYPEELSLQSLAAERLRPHGAVEFNEAGRAAQWILPQWLS